MFPLSKGRHSQAGARAMQRKPQWPMPTGAKRHNNRCWKCLYIYSHMRELVKIQIQKRLLYVCIALSKGYLKWACNTFKCGRLPLRLDFPGLESYQCQLGPKVIASNRERPFTVKDQQGKTKNEIRSNWKYICQSMEKTTLNNATGMDEAIASTLHVLGWRGKLLTKKQSVWRPPQTSRR